MFHGPPQTKVKREVSPSRDFSPCGHEQRLSPYGEKCHYNYRHVSSHYSILKPYCFYSYTKIFCLYKSDSSPRLFLISAYDRKPYGFSKPLTSPPTPVSPCNSAHNPGTHPLQKRVTPPLHTRTQGLPAVPGHIHQRIQSTVHSHSPPFAVPRPPISHPDASYNADHRYDSFWHVKPICQSTLVLHIWVFSPPK